LQTLTLDSPKASGAAVVFRPAAGASVTLAEFVSGDTKTKVGAKRFELRDFKVSSYVRLRWGSEDVTLRNIDAGGLNLTSVSRVQVLGGDYGPVVDGVSHINACGVAGCYPAEDIVIDGAYFHDYTISDPAKHSECLMIWPGRRVTIRNSTFRNCTDFDVLVKPYNTGLVGLPGQIVFENNFFDIPMPGETATRDCSPNCARSGNAIALTQGGGEAWSGVQIRYNSSLGAFRVDPSLSQVEIKGNIGRKDTNYACQKNASFSYNIWSAAKCSPTDHRVGLQSTFVDTTPGRYDLHLLPRSRALGAGDPDSAPRTDIEGKLRPTKLSPDAGASQREPALVRSGRSIGSAWVHMSRSAILASYGAPRRRMFVDGVSPGVKVRVDAFAVRGGWLRVHYLYDRVVAVATTSSYYQTDRDVTAGDLLSKLPVLLSNGAECRQVGKTGLFIRATRSTPARVAELIVTARGYAPLCSKPKR
jgi:hypothetical protein